MRRLAIAGVAVYAILLAAAIPPLWRESVTRVIVGWTASMVRGAPVVASVDPNGPASGRLQTGERILSVEDAASFGAYTPQMRIWNYPPGAYYRMEVSRAGRPVELRLQVGSRADFSSQPFIACLLFISLCNLVAGILVATKRPDLVAARWGWLGCQLTALTYVGAAARLPSYSGWPVPAVAALTHLLTGWNLYAAWRFVDSFPFPVPGGRWWRWSRRFLLTLVVFDLSNPLFILAKQMTGYRLMLIWPAWLASRLDSWNLVIQSVAYLAFSMAMIASMVRNYRLHRDPSVRRRIELLAGSVLFAAGVITATGIYVSLHGGWNPGAIRLANLATVVVPFAFYYALLRYRVFDIRIIVRRGLRYLLARRVLGALTLLPAAVLVVRVVRDPSAPIGSFLNLAGLALFLSAGLSLEFRTRMLAAVDRWFFRTSLDRENVLRRLLVDLARVADCGVMAALAEKRLGEIFLPESIEISEQAVACAPPGGVAAGCIALGPRKSEEPYSDSERDLLEAVAAQIGLVRERIEAVHTERMRIARELHDTLNVGFAGISLHLEAARGALAVAPEQVSESLDAARALATESMREARNSVRGLRSSHDGGQPGSHLEVRLRALAHRSPAVPKVSVFVPQGVSTLVSADAGWHLARIAEEAVSNALKHAGATRVDVEIDAGREQLVLRIRDDGAGFDPSARSQGFGLTGMRERMAQVKGSIEIQSAPGRGTEVLAMAPMAV
jgi:signal transduction histidine kinase